MITLLLLLPVTLVLAWIYARALPAGERWGRFDSSLLLVCVLMASGWVMWARSGSIVNAGPIYPELLAAAGAYPLILLSLAAGLAWRHARHRQRAGSQ